MVSASVTVPDTTRVIFQSIFKVPKKVRFRGEGMISLDPKKVDIFQFFGHSNYAHIGRPRTIRCSLQPS